MSKTLGAIFNSLYGPALGAVVGGGQGAVKGLANLAAAYSGPIAYGLYVGSAIISSLSTTPPPDTTATAVKTPIPPRVSGYGRSKFFGAYILFETTRTGTAVDVYAVHDGLMDGAELFYLGDKSLTTIGATPGGLSDGAYSGGTVTILYRQGLATETAFGEVVSLLPTAWSNQHRGDGVVTAAVIWRPVKSADYQKIYPSGQPPLAIVARWQRVFDWRDSSQSVTDPSTWKWSENACLHLAHYLLVRDNKDWSTHFLPTLTYWTAAANDCDVQMPILSFATLLVLDAKPDGDHTLLVEQADGLRPGMQVTITSAADATTQTVTVTSVSPHSSTDGVGFQIGINPEITTFYPQGSAVTWQSTSAYPLSEPRYRSCFAHKHTDAHKDVKAGLLACFDGWLSPRADGALMIFSGRYTPPTVSIGPDEIVSYSIQDGVDEENAINSIAVTYVSAAHQYNTVDTDPWTDENDIARRGKVLADQLANQVPSYTQARRLAKRKMAQIMAPKRGTITTNFAGRIVRGQRFVHIDLIEAGVTFYSGPVEMTKLVRNIATGGVTFDWIMAGPDIDSWNAATESGNPAPVGNRVAPEPLAAPVITSATKNLQAVSGDGTGVRVRIVGTGPDRNDLIWFARWRVVGDAIWNEARYPDLAPGASVTIDTGFVPASATVETAIAYQIADGRLSPYSTAVTVNTSAPGASSGVLLSYPVNLTLTAAADGTITISDHIRRYPDVDVSVTGATIASGLTPGTGRAIYYDDPTRAGGAVTYHLDANDIAARASSANPDRVYVGYITIPTAGSPPTSSGGASPPGGYCVTVDTPIMTENDPQKLAGNIVVGDRMWTRHEASLAWGFYPVEAVEIVSSNDIWQAEIGGKTLKATGDHLVYVGAWVAIRDLPGALQILGPYQVAKITVTSAHTYVSNGILSHNVKSGATP